MLLLVSARATGHTSLDLGFVLKKDFTGLIERHGRRIWFFFDVVFANEMEVVDLFVPSTCNSADSSNTADSLVADSRLFVPACLATVDVRDDDHWLSVILDSSYEFRAL
jgi:hypothetical protein